jgi:hypothetical protein
MCVRCTLKKGAFSMLCKIIRRFIEVCALGAVIGLWSGPTLAQDKLAERATYHSDIDELLTLENVSVMPFTDNLQGIYSRPLEAHLISLVDKMHRWNYIPSNSSGPILAPEELEASPEKALQASQGLGVDAFFACQVTKGPNGITVHLSLFLTKDGKLLAQAILKDYKQFNLPDLKEQMQRLLAEIVARLPYSGRILSREANRVTINLGSRDGIQVGQVLSVIQIIQAQRHPKFNFLIRTEKEIFGRLKVLKVDETLSFGTVLSEKERGAIQKNAKIGPIDFVNYGNGDGLSLAPSPEEALGQRDDGKIVFGKDAHPWQPQAPPTFGQIGARFGLSEVSENMELSHAGSLSSETYTAPSIEIEGEIWVTPEWTFHAQIKQGITLISNPLPGSTPQKLNQLLTDYEAGFGYMFRFGPYIWSPYVEPFLSYFTTKFYTDSSSPQAYTTMDYSGFKLGLHGAMPIDASNKYGIGGIFAMTLKESLDETPVTSGASSTNNTVQFGIFGYQKLGERLKAQVNLDFEMYSTSFAGQGTRVGDSASSASQRYTTLSGGLYYMF